MYLGIAIRPQAGKEQVETRVRDTYLTNLLVKICVRPYARWRPARFARIKPTVGQEKAWATVFARSTGTSRKETIR